MIHTLVVSILNISCDVSRYNIHDCCPSGDAIFTIEISPDMYHNTVSLAVSFRFFCVLHARFLRVVWSFGHTSLSRCFISRFTVESVQCRTSQLEGIPCHEWYSVLLESTQLSLLVSTRLGTWFFPVLPIRLENLEFFVVYLELSRGMKVNEFADLASSEFVSEYTEDKPNIVWSGRKHLETHEYVDEPLDQVKHDSFFQSSDEGRSLLFFFVCVDLSLVLSSFIPRVLRTCHIFIYQDSGPWVASKIRHFWHRGVMFMVW